MAECQRPQRPRPHRRTVTGDPEGGAGDPERCGTVHIGQPDPDSRSAAGHPDNLPDRLVGEPFQRPVRQPEQRRRRRDHRGSPCAGPGTVGPFCVRGGGHHGHDHQRDRGGHYDWPQPANWAGRPPPPEQDASNSIPPHRVNLLGRLGADLSPPGQSGAGQLASGADAVVVFAGYSASQSWAARSMTPTRTRWAVARSSGSKSPYRRLVTALTVSARFVWRGWRSGVSWGGPGPLGSPPPVTSPWASSLPNRAATPGRSRWSWG